MVVSNQARLLHLLLSLAGGSCSRGLLGRRLGETDARVRSLLTMLKERGFVTSSRKGHMLTPEGKKMVDTLGIVGPVGLDAGELTVGPRDAAILVRGAAVRVDKGIEQRDAALIAGGMGATTLVMSESGLGLPFPGTVPTSVAERLLELLPARESDVIIVGTAAHGWSAKRACVAAALTLAPADIVLRPRQGKRI
ncbi:MAG: hypothetical protein QF415_08715 [Candidatus Undinarchaeales archaeon]|jgi:hypothetical protein|nr:hypothetical protein [Candidatus Undinarchaeales archaeon]MDP7494144.1 hypothetical protein [Candidatus Undinarchaeales archaeon]